MSNNMTQAISVKFRFIKIPGTYFFFFFLFQNSKDYIFLWFRCTLCYDIWKFLKKLVLTSLSLTCLTKIKLKQSNLVIQL